MSDVILKNLSIKYDNKSIIENMNINIIKGKITTIVGPNGCGKSSILKSIARLLKFESGSVFVNGFDVVKTPTKNIAKELAILPQITHLPDGVTVEQLVMQGRFPYKKIGKPYTLDDRGIVENAMEKTKIIEFRDRNVNELSGGQKQRAWIALALAQNTNVLLLDEPTTYLDLEHQYEVLDLLRILNKEKNKTIVMVLHDINLAARYSDFIIGIKDGNIYDIGATKEIINNKFIEDVFKVKSHIIQNPIDSHIHCITYS